MHATALLHCAVLESGESWRLFTSLVLHGGLTHLALDTFFLGWMGPGKDKKVHLASHADIWELRQVFLAQNGATRGRTGPEHLGPVVSALRNAADCRTTHSTASSRHCQCSKKSDGQPIPGAALCVEDHGSPQITKAGIPPSLLLCVRFLLPCCRHRSTPGPQCIHVHLFGQWPGRV